MLLDASKSTLLIIDVQPRLFEKIFEFKIIERYILNCTKIFTKLKIPVVYSEQYPQGLGETVDVFLKDLELCNAKRLVKTTFSCFPHRSDSINVKNYIKTKQVILLGIETHICVLQTALDLKNQGFNVYVIYEAVGSRKIKDKELGIERLKMSEITILSFEMMLFELLRDSNNEHFKELSKIIK
mgnify:CR=1 FL=1